MPARKLITLHAPMAAEISDQLLAPARELMDMFGFYHWTDVSTGLANLLREDTSPDMTLMVRTPPVWVSRGPTHRELAHFYSLWNAGKIDEARAFAQIGFPPELR